MRFIAPVLIMSFFMFAACEGNRPGRATTACMLRARAQAIAAGNPNYTHAKEVSPTSYDGSEKMGELGIQIISATRWSLIGKPDAYRLKAIQDQQGKSRGR